MKKNFTLFFLLLVSLVAFPQKYVQPNEPDTCYIAVQLNGITKFIKCNDALEDSSENDIIISEMVVQPSQDLDTGVQDYFIAFPSRYNGKQIIGVEFHLANAATGSTSSSSVTTLSIKKDGDPAAYFLSKIPKDHLYEITAGEWLNIDPGNVFRVKIETIPFTKNKARGLRVTFHLGDPGTQMKPKMNLSPMSEMSALSPVVDQVQDPEPTEAEQAEGISALSAAITELNKNKEENAQLKNDVANLYEEINKLKNMIGELCQVGCSALTNPPVTNTNAEAQLFQNIPNPGSGRISIPYFIPESANGAFIKIYNSIGEELMVYAVQRPGMSNLEIRVDALVPGIYFYSLVIHDQVIKTLKMKIVR